MEVIGVNPFPNLDSWVLSGPSIDFLAYNGDISGDRACQMPYFEAKLCRKLSKASERGKWTLHIHVLQM
jgi:hypothetical protein